MSEAEETLEKDVDSHKGIQLKETIKELVERVERLQGVLNKPVAEIVKKKIDIEPETLSVDGLRGLVHLLGDIISILDKLDCNAKGHEEREEFEKVREEVKSLVLSKLKQVVDAI